MHRLRMRIYNILYLLIAQTNEPGENFALISYFK